MKRNLFLPIFFLFGSLLFSQTDVLDRYPVTQFFYEKGELSFLKDLQDAAIDNGLQPCQDNNEHYSPKWIVFPDHTIKFIKDTDTINIEKNKCAYNFAKNVFKYLDKWQPVIVNQIAYPAIATYDINPSELFKYKINADLKHDFQRPEYRGGNTAFAIGLQKLINPIFDRNHLILNNEVINLDFTISKTGMIEDVDLPQSIPFRMKDEILEAVQGLKKWKPATFNGVPIKQKVSVKLRFES